MFEISCPKMMDDGPEDTARLLLSDTDYSDDVDAGEPTADKEDGNDDVIVSTGKALDQDPQQGCLAALKTSALSAYAFLLTATVTTTVASVLVKVMTSVSPFMLTTFRNLGIFVCSLPRLFHKRIRPFPPEGWCKTKYLLIRALFSAVYSMSLFYSFRHLPLGDARVFASTQPVFTALGARILLGEPFGLFEVAMLVSTLSGIVVVMHPPLIFGGDTVYNSQYFAAAIFMTVGTACQGIGMVATRAIKDIDFALVTAWNGFVSTWPPLIAAVAMQEADIPTPVDAGYAVLIGLLSWVSQTTMVIAVQVEDAGVVSLVRKAFDILGAYVVQVLIFSAPPSASSGIGAGLILASVFLMGAKKVVEKQSKPTGL